MTRSNNKKLNVAMCVAFVMLCLTLVTTYMTAGLLAKYTTGDNASDSARVAKFIVSSAPNKSFETIGSTFVLGDFAPTDEFVAMKTFVIENDSEVSVKCEIDVKNVTMNIPLVFDYTKDVIIAPGGTKEIDLLVKWPVDGALAYIGMVDLFEVNVIVHQID